MASNKPVVKIICGPTGAGKTEVALSCADILGGTQIVSLDAMKVYRGMDIGTAKPSPEILKRFPHHMLSYLDPSESNSMGNFISRAESIIRDLYARSVPFICEGGSIMYIKGLVEGIFEGVGRDDEFRAGLKERALLHGIPALHAELARVDPAAALKIGPNDYKRIERALEVHELTGRPISSFQTQWGKRREDFDIRLVGLRRSREEIYDRINRRAEVMLESGWLDEARSLLERKLSPEARMAHGYRAVFAYLREEISFDEMIDTIRRDTRRYARRQLNWFNKFPGLVWVDAAENDDAEKTAKNIIEEWEKQGIY